MSDSGFWARIRAARIVPILIVYLAACWAVLQGVEALQGVFALPEWVVPVAVALLMIGLVIIGATALIQAHPQTKARSAHGDIPRTWELAPRALVGELVAGEVPHLTWARSILGGVFALGLLFILAGLAALFHHLDGTVGSPEPTGEGADTSSAVIAVWPLGVTADEATPWSAESVAMLSEEPIREGRPRTVGRDAVLARRNDLPGKEDGPEESSQGGLRR